MRKREIEDLLNDIERLKEEKIKAQQMLDETEKELKKLGFDSPQEAETQLQEMDEELEQIEINYKELKKQWNKKWNKMLEEG